MQEMKVRITFTEDLLGTLPKNEEVYTDYVASNAPDVATMEEEIAAFGVENVAEKGKTGFPRENGEIPYLFDYQIKGFFKGACGFLKKVPGTESAGLKAFKKEIDGLIFVTPRKIYLNLSGPMNECQRPLRAQTMQGERVSLACSDAAPAGTTIEFTVTCLVDKDMKLVREWLDYGELSGIGQWRNSGKGRFEWEELK